MNKVTNKSTTASTSANAEYEAAGTYQAPESSKKVAAVRDQRATVYGGSLSADKTRNQKDCQQGSGQL